MYNPIHIRVLEGWQGTTGGSVNDFGELIETLTGDENLLLNDGGKMKQINASNVKFGGGGGVTVFQMVPVVNEGGSN